MSQTWGIVPAAGRGTRIQPLAFSKELLPVGSRIDTHEERPKAVSEYLIDRMLTAGATRICFVVSPGKADIMQYFGGKLAETAICYAVQQDPNGLCDALFTALPFIAPEDEVLIGLPDTIWFPIDGFQQLPSKRLSFLLFPVKRPQLFDAVVTDSQSIIQEIQVKIPNPASNWVWGAIRMSGRILAELHDLWDERERADEYMGTLVNEYIARGGVAYGIRRGEVYVDVGTLHGYHEALRVLAESEVAVL